MKSPNGQQQHMATLENAEEHILRNLARDDRFGAALPLGEIARKKFIESTLAAANATPAPATSRAGWKPLALSLTAAASVLCAFWWVRDTTTVRPDSPPLTAPPSAASEHMAASVEPKPYSKVLQVTNNGFLDGKQLKIGDTLPLNTPIEVSTGSMVTTPAEGIRISFFENTRAEFRRPEPSTFEIHLTQGTLWAAVNPAVVTDHLTVVTPRGRVEVNGTVFFVSNMKNKSEVRVLRGRVSVVDRKGIRQSLPAGQTTTIGSGQSSAMDDADIEHDWAAVTALDLVAGAPPSQEEPTRDADMSTIRRKSALRSESALLHRIRQNRLAGNWQEAAEGYEVLIRNYEGTESAKAALISLGELWLDKFHTPKTALELFDRYLDSGATELKREAMLGKARALGGLGRTDEEKELLQTFVAHFPNALQTPAADARIRELELRIP